MLLLAVLSVREVASERTKLALVLLLSSSGIGRNTARAIQLAKMVSKMIISNVLDGEVEDHSMYEADSL